ncbi:Ada metal-binding domain-containing protein [Profundibacter sp.]
MIRTGLCRRVDNRVFCRLTYPARKPKSENCTFYASVGGCIEAGFRACKRKAHGLCRSGDWRTP